MTRKCSHCSHNGHNSRTCPNKGVKLFGVRLNDGSIRKSASMGNLSHYSVSGSGVSAVGPGSPGDMTPEHAAHGYASEDGATGSASRERKKAGVPWTEEEHRLFLLGLQKLGKGDWRGISRNYVVTRTPIQVASHAQKYFIIQSIVSRGKRRSSLFDIVAEESDDTPMTSRDFFTADEQPPEMQNANPSSPTHVPPKVAVVDEECESMESSNSNNGDPDPPQPENPEPQPCYPIMYYAFPLPALWTGYGAGSATSEEKHEVLKPTAVHMKILINPDHLFGMSKLSLGEAKGNAGPSSLSLKLVDGSRSRQSAFHANPATKTSGMTSSNAVVEAVQRC